jgi:hypothetical protein
MESLPSTRPAALDPRTVAPARERGERRAARERRERASARRAAPEPTEPARDEPIPPGDEPGMHLDVTA